MDSFGHIGSGDAATKTPQTQTAKSKRDDKNTIRQDRKSQSFNLNVGEKARNRPTLFYPHYITK